jgi:hypothetical protein
LCNSRSGFVPVAKLVRKGSFSQRTKTALLALERLLRKSSSYG